MKTSGECFVCGTTVSGKIIAFEDSSDKENARRELLGHKCRACSAVSCIQCSKKAINYGSWHGYDKSVCSKCGTPDPHPPFILGKNLDDAALESEQSEKDQVGSEEGFSADSKSSNKSEISGLFIGITAAAVFMLFSDAPLREGGPAMIRWITDGGYIYIVGAIILGLASPKFMGK
jgi:hypothetical protein